MNKKIEEELLELLKEETEEFLRETHRVDLFVEIKEFIEKYYIQKESFFKYIDKR